MKIWFDSLPIHYTGAQDCECPHRNPSPQSILPLSRSDFARVRPALLQRADSIFIQACGYQKWLLCNTLRSGHVAVLDTEALSMLDRFQLPTTLYQVMQAESNWPRETLEEIGALFHKLGFLYDICERPLPPADELETLTAWLHVTNACNLRCHYCYIAKNNEHMSMLTAYKAVDALFRSALKHHFKSIFLKYAGGEASLQMKSTIAIHDYAVQLAQQQGIDFRASLLSNGVVLSQEAIHNLQERNIDVMISLDGLGATHDSQRPFLNGKGSSQYVLRTIERLLAEGLIPRIAITVSGRSLAGLPDLITYVLERELPFSLNFYRENPCSKHLDDLRFEEDQIITAMQAVFEVITAHLPRKSLLGSFIDKADMSTLHRRTCGVGHNYLAIDQRGGIAKCQADMKHTVTAIDADDPLQEVRDDRTGVLGLPVEEKEGCQTCEWRFWCTGGCPLLTYQATGNNRVKSPNCNIYKALFPQILRLEAMRLLRYQSPLSLYPGSNIRAAIVS
jgi:uncharacterized protein